VADFNRLGLDTVVGGERAAPIVAIDELIDAVVRLLPLGSRLRPFVAVRFRLANVGRPNAGKSTL
jgi:predicted GTPase